MKKLNKIMLALSLLPTLLTSVFLFFMNDTVPMHYNASGAVDPVQNTKTSFSLQSFCLCMHFTWCIPRYILNTVQTALKR